MPQTTAADSIHCKKQHSLLLLLQRLMALCFIGIIGFTLIDFPVAKHWITLGLGVYLILLWRFPSAWLIVIPALLPILDLTPWTGRTFFNEFDLFILASCTAAYLQNEPWVHHLKFSRGTWLLLLLLVSWQTFTTLNGLFPLQPIDTNSFNSYYSHYNSLRIAKGFFFTLLLLLPLGQAIGRNDPVTRLFSTGMLGGLCAALLAIIWERFMFTGLFNFHRQYRVTGFFSEMSMGGGSIDSHLIISLPFIAFIFLAWRRASAQFFGFAVLAVAIYSLAVTFSRASYLAAIIMAFTMLAAWTYSDNSLTEKRPKTRRYIYLTIGVVILVMAPVLTGNYIHNRFLSLSSDFSQRTDHWARAVQIMPEGWQTTLFGMGKGVFPRAHLQDRSINSLSPTTQHQIDKGNQFVRLAGSGQDNNIQLRQRFKITEAGPYQLQIDLRSQPNQPANILIKICERLVFQPYLHKCRKLTINTNQNPHHWQSFNESIDVKGLKKNRWWKRPVDIEIINQSRSESIDIDNIQLITPSGEHLLSNSKLDSGLDYWFFSSSAHANWHIDNTLADAFFEGGWIGISILLILLFALIYHLFLHTKQGDHFSILLLSALVGLIALGAFNSIFDSPKIGFLFFLGIWISLTSPVARFSSSNANKK